MNENNTEHISAELKYRDHESTKAVVSVIIRAVLGIITTYGLLVWMTGTDPGFSTAMPVMFILYAVTAAVFYLPIRSLPWYKPLILNACMGAGMCVFYNFIGPVVAMLVELFSRYMSSSQSELTVFYAVILLIAAANYTLYYVTERLPEGYGHGFFITLLLELLNGVAFFIGLGLGVWLIMLTISF